MSFNFNKASSSFDTMIAKGLVLKAATMILPVGSKTVIDGTVDGPQVMVESDKVEGVKVLGVQVTKEKVDLETTLVVNGSLRTYNDIIVPNVMITGQVKCDKIVVEGTLAIKAGAKVDALEIRYRNLIIEDGAIVLAKMSHLDHIAEGEQGIVPTAAAE